MDHHVFRQAGHSCKVLATVVTLFWQTGQRCQWQVIWCLRNHQIIHDVRSLCISTMWFFNFFLLERTLKQEIHKWQNRPREIQPSCPPPTAGCPTYPPHPFSYPASPPHHRYSPSASPILLLLPLLQGICKSYMPSLFSCRDLYDSHLDMCIQACPPPFQRF